MRRFRRRSTVESCPLALPKVESIREGTGQISGWPTLRAGFPRNYESTAPFRPKARGDHSLGGEIPRGYGFH